LSAKSAGTIFLLRGIKLLSIVAAIFSDSFLGVNTNYLYRQLFFMTRLLKHCFLFLLFFAFRFVGVYGASVSGKITNEKGEPLSFANVYAEATTLGTTANVDGIYKLELKPGTYRLIFRYIGYKVLEKNIEISTANINLNVELEPQKYELSEVVISASAEDPAYAIIRKAIKKRKQYLTEIREYTSDVYMKGMQKVASYPKKLFGQEIDLGPYMDTATGIIYLSESVSKFAFRQPDKKKEEMISSKVSGDSKGFSFNQASLLLFNFYENNIAFTKRGLVSPIAATAMLYYHYRLEGTFIENGITINKIEVIPIRSYDPVFRGYIYIMDDTWRIHSADLMVTKEAQLEFIDSLRVRQVYFPVDNKTWFMQSCRFGFVFNVLGFKGNGYFLGVNSNVDIKPNLPENYFGNEVLNVNADANKKDSAYWNEFRPVPLTAEENTDYHRRDSSETIRKSKLYLDSLDRKDNKLTLNKIFLTGYYYTKSFEKKSFYVSSLTQNIQFNTVEGWNASLRANYEINPEDNRDFSLTGNVRYGFSNEHLNGFLSASKIYNALKRSSWVIKAGTDVLQYNNNNPIGAFINTLYTLFGEQNYMKVYEKYFISIAHSSELFNGFHLGIGAEYSDRLPLVNTNYHTFNDISKRIYTSNNPMNPYDDTPAFIRHQSLLLSGEIRIRFAQKYMTRPYEKINLDSKYPSVFFRYIKSLPEILGSDNDYDFVSCGIQDSKSFGLAGTSSFIVEAGKFLSAKRLEFMDYKHFHGNQVVFTTLDNESFNLLNYYSYSTTAPFIEAHFEHDFGGLIFNKIPLLRKLKISEIGQLNLVSIEGRTPYYEIAAGIEKLGVFRASYSFSFMGSKPSISGLVIGIKIN
jgi:hypothetical protein